MKREQKPDPKLTSVAVTGVGMITPLGIDIAGSWDGFRKGYSGIQKISKFDADSCCTQIGGQLPLSLDALVNQRFTKRLQKQTTRLTRLALLTAEQTIQQSHLDLKCVELTRGAVIIGTSGASVNSLNDPAPTGAERFTIIREMVNSIPAQISLEYGFGGPSYVISASSESSACAISMAFDLIQTGMADFAIAGGVDALLSRSFVDYFNGLDLLTTNNIHPESAVKPFDSQRNGFVLSDASCLIMLENLDHARKRGAKIYALMAGYASCWNGSLSADTMAENITAALCNSGMKPSDIGYINANGVATRDHDRMEALAIGQVFGSKPTGPRVGSIKSMIGHTMGASTAIALSVTALMLNFGEFIPNVNLKHADPGCELNHLPDRLQQWTGPRAAVCNSFGFKGHHYALVLTHPDDFNSIGLD